MPDIVIAGATYTDVPQIDVPKAGGGTASFYANGGGGITITETPDIGGGTIIEISGSTPILTTKTITENGTYSAEDDDADGYSEVTVNVSGGGTDYLAQSLTNTLETYFSNDITGISRQYAFRNSTVKTLSFPNCTSIANYTFSYCSQLESINMPKLTTAVTNTFESCSKLTTVVFPSCTAVYSSAFQNCTKLETMDLAGGGNQIGGSAFSNDSALNALILRSDSVTPLNNINAFNNTPFASGKAGGTLYVPQAQIASYQSASNWSTLLGYTNNQIKSIESTHTDPNAPIDLTLYYADGTPIS